MTRVSRPHLEATIAVFKEKVAIHERVVHFYKLKGTREREAIIEAAPMLGLKQGTLDRLLSAHRDFDAANGDMLTMQLAQLKSELAIHEAMLAEGERNIVMAPPGSKLT